MAGRQIENRKSGLVLSERFRAVNWRCVVFAKFAQSSWRSLCPCFWSEVLISAQEESFLKGRESVSQKRSL